MNPSAAMPSTPAPATEVRPRVSVLLPTYQERSTIVDCLNSLSAQDYPHIAEILVIDGGSTDGTLEIIDRFVATGRADPPIRTLRNPRVTAAAAMNVGLSVASADVIVRADAHSLYAPDYVRRNVEVLLATGATNVGGPMRAVGTTAFGRAVAAVTSTPFGVGPGRFHYAARRMEVETVYLGCWWTDELRRLGGWDEDNLQWAAEDQELNFRIRLAGGRIVLDPDITSYYFPRESPSALWRQYRNYGLAKASTLARHRTLPYWRPLVPAGFVAAAIAGAVVGRRPVTRVAVPAIHLLTSTVAAVRLSRAPGVAPHRALAAIEICHWSYGVGFLGGLLRIVSGRPFDHRPGGRR